MITFFDITLHFTFTLITFSLLLGIFIGLMKLINLFVFQEIELNKKAIIIAVILSGIIAVLILLQYSFK